MSSIKFSPGFRISLVDIAILCIGLIGAFVFGVKVWWAGMIIGFVVLHFFFFCNVFRISRLPELIWAIGFAALTASTILSGFPGWIATIFLSLLLSSFLIWRETKRDDYHGIYWKKWNPDLPKWWESRFGTSGIEQNEAR